MGKPKRDLGQEILEGIREIKRGEHGRVVMVPPVATVRAATGLSQSRFAELLGVSVRTLQEWEQGRCAPAGAALTQLLIVARKLKCWSRSHDRSLNCQADTSRPSLQSRWKRFPFFAMSRRSLRRRQALAVAFGVALQPLDDGRPGPRGRPARRRPPRKGGKPKPKITPMSTSAGFAMTPSSMVRAVSLSICSQQRSAISSAGDLGAAASRAAGRRPRRPPCRPSCRPCRRRGRSRGRPCGRCGRRRSSWRTPRAVARGRRSARPSWRRRGRRCRGRPRRGAPAGPPATPTALTARSICSTLAPSSSR